MIINWNCRCRCNCRARRGRWRCARTGIDGNRRLAVYSLFKFQNIHGSAFVIVIHYQSKKERYQSCHSRVSDKDTDAETEHHFILLKCCCWWFGGQVQKWTPVHFISLVTGLLFIPESLHRFVSTLTDVRRWRWWCPRRCSLFIRASVHTVVSSLIFFLLQRIQ